MRLAVFSYREDEAVFFKEFCEKYQVEPVYITEAPGVHNAELAKGCDCASVITTKIDKEVIDALSRQGVTFISTRTIGYDHIDIQHAKSIHMGVGNVTYSPYSVSEYAVMLILMANRKIKTIMNRAAGQDYTLKNVRGLELRKQTVGVIGTGKIGEHVIRTLSGFGCKILAYDIHQKESIKEYAEYAALDTIYEQCDVITLHAPSTQDNYHMLDSSAFHKMKDGVIIVNTARGTLIDTDALIDAVESGKVGAAALDVVENETAIYYSDYKNIPINHRQMAILNSFPNVIMLPHTAFYTNMAVSDMVENSILSCLYHFQGKENPWQIV